MTFEFLTLFFSRRLEGLIGYDPRTLVRGKRLVTGSLHFGAVNLSGAKLGFGLDAIRIYSRDVRKDRAAAFSNCLDPGCFSGDGNLPRLHCFCWATVSLHRWIAETLVAGQGYMLRNWSDRLDR